MGYPLTGESARSSPAGRACSTLQRHHEARIQVDFEWTWRW
ncbi:hypothetical protein KCH_25110 [Kitasatospora cheerisanensis KCTC 2395]|uniref:Uncharacterized protein n=1 Tax=Kitasatospora cheerisanensis KCTC 2395 TaxID=1348663 RepID=A0A066YWD1_9ACTN|nr:hypothetical protein KCH_25110 [Kitasatospora cheerisanensis KCTC 2395]